MEEMDFGVQVVHMPDGKQQECYVKRFRCTCPECGRLLEGFSKVSMELANLNGDAADFAEREHQMFLKQLGFPTAEQLAAACNGAEGNHGLSFPG